MRNYFPFPAFLMVPRAYGVPGGLRLKHQGVRRGMCVRIKWLSAVVAIAAWTIGAALALVRPELREWLMFSLAVAITSTCVLGVVVVAWTSQGVYRLGYDVGWKDGRRAERMMGGARGTVVQLRRGVDV